jgi:hypothetical protein
MSVPRFTVEQKREHVYAYMRLPLGAKAGYVSELGVSGPTLRRWRRMVFAGTLELGLVPRGGNLVSVEESAGLVRLLKENALLREELATRQAAHEKALAAKDAELTVQSRAVDALGKAIEILHKAGASKSSQPTGATGEA